jgi:type I restriction enzyme, S subunit
MPSEWQETTLGEVATVRSGFAFKSSDWVEKGVPVVKISNVKDGRVVLDGCSYVTPEVATEADEYRLCAGDILVAMTGYIGDVALVRDDSHIMLNQRVGRFEVKRADLLDPLFLFYFLRLPGIRSEMEGRGYGSAQPNISPDLIHAIEMPLPPLREQRSIARVLGALDDKIELNRKMNETLEQMARAIFKAWFVDFEPFRGKGMVDSPLGKVPKGWKAVSVSNICKRIFSGGTPSTARADYWGGCLPWLSSGETRHSFIIDTEKTITPLGVENSSTRLARAGSTVIAGAGQGHTRGQTSMLTFDSYINQSVVALEADRGRVSDAYLFFGLERRYEEFRQVSDGHSSRGSLTTKLLGGLTIALPPQEVVGEFDRKVAPAIRQITVALQQSRTLAAIRDALLPKLMSGEVEVA